ncbi:phosphatidylinositol kinase [Weissella soli]|uniref:metallophosphoesterase n=1 Tax=Weissella soli TaxID=155866 RepID=UPI0021BF9052|nr:metallophosphoesterase [Weissella soli]MCT8394318.1 phosphatidylinositol kinase [Weissella soli]
MTKIAFSSDNHFDINKQDLPAVIAAQTEFLLTNAIEQYYIGGDLFNDFLKSTAFVEQLQAQLGHHTTVYFIAGNHDMGRHVTFAELENNPNSHYIHNQIVPINDHWQVIANNGWYDYSFASGPRKEDVAVFKRGLYFDRVIQQPMSDLERTDLSLHQIETALAKATKKTIILQHFAPIGDDLAYPVNDPRWLMINGVMGSKRYGDLFKNYPVIKKVIYGHTHFTVPVRVKDAITYQNVSIGYNHHRLTEWTADTFIQSWINKLSIMVLTD